MTYDEIKQEIESAPPTWLPGLLRAVIESALKARCFVPGGLEKFVGKVVERGSR